MAKQDRPETPQHETSKIDVLADSSHVTLQAGSVLLDRYEVIGLLGKGGMGSVFHIRHLHLQSDFALKVLNKQADKTIWRRFENEARTASRLDHPNLIKVYDSGLLPDGQPFIVMELVRGQTLSDLIAKHGRIPLRKTLKIFIQVGFALAYAHENGVIHRDLKPSNIMLTKGVDGSLTSFVKVVDLGIAKLTGIEEFTQQSLTRTGEIFGSPLYMSPEQCKGTPVDGRSDLYSLGCAMYEALTGAPPFVGENALATMIKHQAEPALSLKEASLGIEFPRAVESLVSRLLEKDPAARFSSAPVLTAELVKIEHEFSENETESVSNSGSVQLPDAPALGVIAFVKEHSLTLLLMLLSYFLGMTTILMKTPSQVTPSIARKVPAPLIPFPNGSAKRTEIDRNEKSTLYFSTLSKDGRTRLFRFPKDQSVGKIFRDGKPALPAIGDVALSVDEFFVFSPAPRYLDSVRLLKRFRPEELRGLELNDEARSSLDVFEILPTLHNLSWLEIAMDVDDQAIQYIKRLAKLDSLTVSSTKITGNAIASLPTLPNFVLLSCSGINDPKALADKLSKTHLRKLDIEVSNLSPADLEKICKIDSLEELFIGGNSAIDDKALKSVIRLKKLINLHVSGCNLTSKSVSTLASLKTLKYLQISEGMFNDAEVRALKKQLKAAIEVYRSPGE